MYLILIAALAGALGSGIGMLVVWVAGPGLAQAIGAGVLAASIWMALRR